MADGVGRFPVTADVLARWRVDTGHSGAAQEISTLIRRITSLSRVALYFFQPQDSIPLYRARLNSFSSGSQFSTACRVVAELIHQYVAHSFLYPPHLSRHNPHWTATISRDGEGGISFKGAGIYQALEYNEEKLRAAIEATLLNGACGVMERVSARAVDRDSFDYDSGFLVDFMIDLVSRAGNHLHGVNSSVHFDHIEKNNDIIRAEFGKDLHKGLSCDPRLNVAERRQFAINHFFHDLSVNLLEIAFPNGKADIQMMVGFQSTSFKLLRDIVLPNILHDLTEEVISRSNLNNIVLQGIHLMNSPEKVEKATNALRRRNFGRDGRQKRFDKACSRLVFESVKLFAPSISSILAVGPGVFDGIGSSIGEAFRRQVESTDLLAFLNSLIEKGLPSVHSGVWQKADDIKVFIPGALSDDGCFEASRRLKFKFPKNDFERRNLQEEEELYNEMLEKEVVVALTEKIQSYIKSIIPSSVSFMIAPFKELRRMLHEEILPFPALYCVKALEAIFHFLIFRIVGTILMVVLLPVTGILNTLINRYSRNKAQEILRRIHMDIHKNLAYSFWDQALAALRLEKQTGRFS